MASEPDFEAIARETVRSFRRPYDPEDMEARVIAALHRGAIETLRTLHPRRSGDDR